MIFVVSATRTAEVSELLDPIAPLQDDEEVVAIHEELLDKFSADELGIASTDEPGVTADEKNTASEELDSSTALLSPPSGPELLASSPQAARNKARAGAKSVGKILLYFIQCLLSRFVFYLLNLHPHFFSKSAEGVDVAVINAIQHANKSLFIINMHR